MSGGYSAENRILSTWSGPKHLVFVGSCVHSEQLPSDSADALCGSYQQEMSNQSLTSHPEISRRSDSQELQTCVLVASIFCHNCVLQDISLYVLVSVDQIFGIQIVVPKFREV